MNKNKISIDEIKILFLRFSFIYGEKWTRFFEKDPNGLRLQLCEKEWLSGLQSIDPMILEQAINECRETVDWVPSIAEFRRLCEKNMGIPQLSEIMQLGIRNPKCHPLVYKIYNKVGSFDFKNASAKDLERKIKDVYADCLMEYRENSINNKLLSNMELEVV